MNNMINITVNRKSTVQKKIKEMVRITPNTYPLFRCREVLEKMTTQKRKKKVIVPGTAKQEFIKFVKV